MSAFCTHHRSTGNLWLTHFRTRLYARQCPFYFLVFAIIVFLCLWVGAGRAQGQRLVPDIDQKTIVLDPGHGGNDRGAVGPDGKYEKDVTMAVAQSIADRLKNRYRIILTRSGDYAQDIFNRTAIANHQNADLFISIHTGGDFLHKTSGISIFTYQESNDAIPSSPEASSESGQIEIAWDSVQMQHKTDSKQLANFIYDRLCSQQSRSSCKMQQAPLLVLVGANMPALLIEIGYITNPQDELRMGQPENFSRMVTSISEGIDQFLKSYDHQIPQ